MPDNSHQTPFYLKKSWQRETVKNALLTGFIYVDHLVYIMAIDAVYYEIIPELYEKWDCHIRKPKLHNTIEVWTELLDRLSRGGHYLLREMKIPAKGYIYVYWQNPKTGDYEKQDPEFFNRADIEPGPRYFKLDDIEDYFTDFLEIPLPRLIFPEYDLPLSKQSFKQLTQKWLNQHQDIKEIRLFRDWERGWRIILVPEKNISGEDFDQLRDDLGIFTFGFLEDIENQYRQDNRALDRLDWRGCTIDDGNINHLVSSPNYWELYPTIWFVVPGQPKPVDTHPQEEAFDAGAYFESHYPKQPSVSIAKPKAYLTGKQLIDMYGTTPNEIVDYMRQGLSAETQNGKKVRNADNLEGEDERRYTLIKMSKARGQDPDKNFKWYSGSVFMGCHYESGLNN